MPDNDSNNSHPTGRVLILETGSRTTRIGYYVNGLATAQTRIVHDQNTLSSMPTLMDQQTFRRDAVLDFLEERGVDLLGIDLIMARGGLFAPVRSGVYRVNRDMRDVLLTCRDGIHACNLGAVVADDIADIINEMRRDGGVSSQCLAYIADAPMSDEMLPECRVGGIPELPRRAFFHALNSKAAVREHIGRNGLDPDKFTAIVAHIGAGTTVSLHRGGEVIDTNNGLGGDGPMTTERAGTCPAFPLVELCFSGKYTENEVKQKLVGAGGAKAYFGTTDITDIITRADGGDIEYSIFLDAMVLGVAKGIAAAAATACGKVDAILLTGDFAGYPRIVDGVSQRISFIAPVHTYAREHHFESLASYGYDILAGKTMVHKYNKNAIIPD